MTPSLLVERIERRVPRAVAAAWPHEPRLRVEEFSVIPGAAAEHLMVVRHEDLQKLRAPNQPAFASPLQEHLDAWIEGRPFDLEGLSADRLTALLRVLTWLPPGVEGASRHAVEAKLDLRSRRLVRLRRVDGNDGAFVPGRC